MIAQRAVRGTAFVLVSSYANMAIGFVATILLTRMLRPADFGVMALAGFFFSSFDLRSKLGLDYAFVHRQESTEELIATHLGLQIALSAGTIAITLIAMPILQRLGYEPRMTAVLVALSIIGIVEAAGTTPRAALEKELVFARSTVVITSSLLLANLLAVVLAWRGVGVLSLVAQLAGNALFSTIGFWWVSRLRARPRFQRQVAAWLLRFGLNLIIASIATVVLLQFDYFLIGTLVNATALGYYERAYKVAQWPTGLVTHVVSRTAFPTYAKLQNDREQLSRAFGMTLWLITTVALPLALAIFAAAPDFVRLLFGEAWLPSATLLRFLIAYSVLRPILDDTGALFNAVGQPRRISRVLGIQAVTLIAVATPLTLRHQAVGTAIGVGIAFIVGIVVAYGLMRRTIDLSLVAAFRTPALGLAAGIVSWWLLTRWNGLGDVPLFVRVLLQAGVAAGAFYAVAFLLEGRLILQRVRLIWSLFRSQPQEVLP